MPDFSHLSRLPLSSFLKPVQNGEILSDEFFDHILDRIEPPLFDKHRMKALRAELCWFAPRAHRGRPRKGCSRKELAAAVRHIHRNDVPASLITAIYLRLAAGAPKDRLLAPRRSMLERQKVNNLSMMRAIYKNLVGIASEGNEALHPLLAEKAEALRGHKRLREEAVEVTQAIMRDNLGLNPPSVRRMRNLL